LDPDLVAQVGFHRRLEAAAHECLRELNAALGNAAIGLTEREARALAVPDHTGRLELGGAIDDASDRPLGGDCGGCRAAWVDGLDAVPVVGAAVAVEVPPGHAVLR